MYSLANLFTKEPAAIAGAIRAVLHTLVLGGILVLDAPLLAGISLAIEVVLTLFVRHNVTPTAAPSLEAGTRVQVAGTTDAVVIQPTPPGPEGIDNPEELSG